uniref:Uncharacterized protein n=1 Tax=Timema bartmani TaxID=61472 RepID=A0A7R9I314_9NEOP|nr:unnamed protein product [Timema bartmani]
MTSPTARDQQIGQCQQRENEDWGGSFEAEGNELPSKSARGIIVVARVVASDRPRLLRSFFDVEVKSPGHLGRGAVHKQPSSQNFSYHFLILLWRGQINIEGDVGGTNSSGRPRLEYMNQMVNDVGRRRYKDDKSYEFIERERKSVRYAVPFISKNVQALGPPGSTGPPGPGTPIMPSPQDSSNSGGENMYTMMKSVPGGNMPGITEGAVTPDGNSIEHYGKNIGLEPKKKECVKGKEDNLFGELVQEHTCPFIPYFGH